MNCTIKLYLIIIYLLLTVNQSFAQYIYRLRADFSIKTKMANGTESLVVGQVFYDKNTKKLIYQNTFPEKETFVSLDTILYKIINGKVVEQKTIPPIAYYSVFHLVMNGQLANYGLEKSNYKIENTEKQNDMVLTTWKPPQKYKDKLGKICISNKENRIYGIIFYGTSNEIISKTFFEEYQKLNGVEFPTKMVLFQYHNQSSDIQVITFSKLQANEKDNNSFYDMSIVK